MIIAHGIVHRGTVVVLQLLFPESQQLGIKNLFVVRSVFAIRTAFQYSKCKDLHVTQQPFSQLRFSYPVPQILQIPQDLCVDIFSVLDRRAKVIDG